MIASFATRNGVRERGTRALHAHAERSSSIVRTVESRRLSSRLWAGNSLQVMIPACSTFFSLCPSIHPSHPLILKTPPHLLMAANAYHQNVFLIISHGRCVPTHTTDGNLTAVPSHVGPTLAHLCIKKQETLHHVHLRRSGD